MINFPMLIPPFYLYEILCVVVSIVSKRQEKFTYKKYAVVFVDNFSRNPELPLVFLGVRQRQVYHDSHAEIPDLHRLFQDRLYDENMERAQEERLPLFLGSRWMRSLFFDAISLQILQHSYAWHSLLPAGNSSLRNLVKKVLSCREIQGKSLVNNPWKTL